MALKYGGLQRHAVRADDYEQGERGVYGGAQRADHGRSAGVGFAELADDEADATLKATLRDRYKMVCEARDMGLAAAAAGPSEQGGH